MYLYNFILKGKTVSLFKTIALISPKQLIEMKMTFLVCVSKQTRLL